MIKKINGIAILFILCILYFAFLIITGMTSGNGEVPVLTVPTQKIEISVKDKESVLLQGVKCKDEEDGDISNKVFIESISSFDDHNERTITYAVFDSDDNLSRVTRKLKYTDYEEPVINVKIPFVYYYHVSNDEFLNYLTANSSIDGNISSLITLDKVSYNNNVRNLVFSVTDSCGIKSSLELKTTELSDNPNIDITLKAYSKKVKIGTDIATIAPRANIKSVELMGISDDSLIYDVEITNDYNPNKAGTYEFIYRIAKANGDYGLTKMIVVVEE